MSGQGVSSVPRLPILLAIQLESYRSAVVLFNRLMVAPPFSLLLYDHLVGKHPVAYD